jgi:dipeptidyl aminopeptidase/acylaminoacyl peptidase
MSYSIHQYLNIRSASGGALSPNGAELAFISNITGIPQAWVVSTSGGWPRPLTLTDNPVRLVRWSPDGQWILFTMDAKGDERTQLHLVRPDASETVALTDNSQAIYSFGDWSLDGAKICYSSNERDERYFDVYVMDVRTRQAQRVFQQDGSNYAVRFGADGNASVLFSRSNGSMDADLFVVDLQISEVMHLTPHEGAAVFNSPCFWEDALWVLTDLDRDFVNLACIDPKMRNLSNVRHDDADLESLTFADGGKRWAYAINRGGVSEIWIHTPSSRKRIERLPRGVATNLRMDRAGRFLSFDFSGPMHHPNVWVYDIRKNKLMQVTHSDRAGIAPASFVAPQLVHYKTFDGRQIPAWFYLPAGAQRDGSLPTIVYLHGGPESQTRADFNPIIQYFVNNGYAVLAPNVRGSTGYGKTYHHLDDVAKRMDSVRDAAMAVEYLKSSGYAHPQKMACMGGSYGGFMVLSLVTQYPDLWAAGVDLYGVANFISFFKHTGPYRRKHRASEYGNPDKDADFLRSISPIHRVDRITAPMMILQGATDPRVPQEESDQMVAALRQRGVPVEYIVFPDEGHGILKLNNRVRAYGAIVQFLDRYLK